MQMTFTLDGKDRNSKNKFYYVMEFMLRKLIITTEDIWQNEIWNLWNLSKSSQKTDLYDFK